MKLCDFCGFVIKEQEAQCSNCRMIVPGRESLVAPPKAVSLEKPPVSSVPVNSISSYIPKKFIAQMRLKKVKKEQVRLKAEERKLKAIIREK